MTEVVEIFIRHLKTKAEAFAGEELTAVVHGRPVRFVDDDDAADAKAQRVLEGIANRVGFKHVAFVYEPIAAAYNYEETATREEIVLIADIGGGTSDFTVIRIGPERRALRRPLGRHSRQYRRADRRHRFRFLLSLDAVMPLLGLGTHLIEKNLPMPNSLYFELATWSTINFTYTYQNERMLRRTDRRTRASPKRSRVCSRSSAAASATASPSRSRTQRSRSARRTARRSPSISSKRDLSARDARRIRPRDPAQEPIGCIATASRSASPMPASSRTPSTRSSSPAAPSRVPAVRDAIVRAAPAPASTTGSDFLSVALGLTREAQRRFA